MTTKEEAWTKYWNSQFFNKAGKVDVFSIGWDAAMKEAESKYRCDLESLRTELGLLWSAIDFDDRVDFNTVEDQINFHINRLGVVNK